MVDLHVSFISSRDNTNLAAPRSCVSHSVDSRRRLISLLHFLRWVSVSLRGNDNICTEFLECRVLGDAGIEH